MMLESFNAIDWLPILFRITALLAAGWMGLIILRKRQPAAAITIARVMLMVVWIMTPVLAFGWLIPVPVVALRAPATSAPTPQPIAEPVPSQRPSPPSTLKPEATDAASINAVQTPMVSPTPPSVSMEAKLAPLQVSPSLEPDNGPPTLGVASRPFPAAQLLGLTWVLISSILLLRMVIGQARTRRLVAGANDVDDDVCELAGSLLDEKYTRPRMMFSQSVAGPCTAGFFRPTILLPREWFSQLTQEQQRMVLAHELSHAIGADARWDVVAQITRSVFWFHPLLLGIVRSHRLACEHRCDHAASRQCDQPQDYRRQLAAWALDFHQGTRHPSNALAMAERSLMIRRLRWLKQTRGNTPLTKPRKAALALSIIAAVTVGLVAPTYVASASPDDPPKTKQEGTTDKEEPATKFFPIVWGEAPLKVDLKVAVDLKVKVVDQQNVPVKDAEVFLSIVRDSAGTSASMPMTSGYLSDADGIARVKIPKGSARVSLSTKAEGFAKHSGDFSPGGAAEIRLQRGRIIKVRSVDEDGKLLEDAFPILQSSNIMGREFVKQDDGSHHSPVVKDERTLMQVAASVPDRPMLFSGLIDTSDPSLAGEDDVIELTLKPGVKIEGELDESVPRPIKGGFVELLVVEGKDQKIERRGIQWQDTVPIRPDGRFVFPSVPPGGHAQLFVLGDGFQSTNPTEQELRDYFKEHDAGGEAMITGALNRPDILPRLVRLTPNDGENTVRVKLPCRETASLDVRVIDPAGNPIAGAVGSMNPNGYFLSGELFIPGTEYSTRQMVSGSNAFMMVAGLVGNSPRDFVTKSFLQVKSDEKGIVRFRNIPSRRDSYEIEADGYVMAAHPTSSIDDPGRYALIQLADGEQATRTITMERDLPRKFREVTVVYHDGRPLDDTEVTVTEITTSDNNSDWQQWSVQRLGPLSKGKTDENGRIVLSYPEKLEGQPVNALRLHLRGHPERDVSYRTYVSIPAESDSRVVKIQPAKAPRSPGALRIASAVYEALKSDAPPSELLKRLTKKPSVVGLQELLNLNEYDAATVLELKAERNIVRMEESAAVEAIETSDGNRTVVLASVRPKGATWIDRPELRFPPEVGFIFDEDGKLVSVVGGNKSASGDLEDIMLTDLGGTRDYFLVSTAFESHPPYKYYSKWYHIGSESKPALTVHHFANSRAWSGRNGRSVPRSEFGYMEYEFNGRDIDHQLPGTMPNGVDVPRKIMWDRARQTFVGATTQAFNGESLYRVVEAESSEFEGIAPEKNSIISMGGRRDFDNWHHWLVMIPDDKQYALRLFIREDSGEIIREFDERDISAGMHSLQLHFADTQNDKVSKLKITVDVAANKKTDEHLSSHIPVDASPTVKGQGVVAIAEGTLRLFDKKLDYEQQSLVWMVEAKK